MDIVQTFSVPVPVVVNLLLSKTFRPRSLVSPRIRVTGLLLVGVGVVAGVVGVRRRVVRRRLHPEVRCCVIWLDIVAVAFVTIVACFVACRSFTDAFCSLIWWRRFELLYWPERGCD